MEKILLALDAQNINIATVDFACYLARLTNSRLTGIFLEDLLSEPVFGAFEQVAEMKEGHIDANSPTKRNEITEANIQLFHRSCECRGISAKIHRDRGIPVDEVVEESRFADLVIIDSETSFSRKKGPIPGRFVKEVLEQTECPVIIAPFAFHGVDEIIFAYDGSASCVFAIKQFTYLFPEWKQKKFTLINVREKKDAIEQQYKMKEWLQQHYTNVELKILTGNSSDELFGYLIDKKNAMVVIGAYGRSILSRFFTPSHAHLLVKTVNLPIFIAHH